MKNKLKSTEFWLTLIALVVGFLMTTGAIPESKALGIILTGLASAGYSYSRGKAKEFLGDLKPGFLTTEFWFTILTIFNGVIAGYVGEHTANDEMAAVLGVGMAVGSYGPARGMAKNNVNALVLLCALFMSGCVSQPTPAEVATYEAVAPVTQRYINAERVIKKFNCECDLCIKKADASAHAKAVLLKIQLILSGGKEPTKESILEARENTLASWKLRVKPEGK